MARSETLGPKAVQHGCHPLILGLAQMRSAWLRRDQIIAIGTYAANVEFGNHVSRPPHWSSGFDSVLRDFWTSAARGGKILEVLADQAFSNPVRPTDLQVWLRSV